MIYSSFIFVYFVPTNSLSVSSLFLDCDVLILIFVLIIICIFHASLAYRKSWCTMISIVLDLDVSVDVDHQSDSADQWLQCFWFFYANIQFLLLNLENASKISMNFSLRWGRWIPLLSCKPAGIVGKHGLGHIFEFKRVLLKINVL